MVLRCVEIPERPFQIANSSMHDLGRSARSLPGKVASIEKNGVQTAQLRIESASGAGRTGTDHTDIERLSLDGSQRLASTLHFLTPRTTRNRKTHGVATDRL